MGIPGVQRKLSLSKIIDKKENKSPRLTIVGYLGGEYILKPPTHEYPYMPEIEDLTMHLAQMANIEVVSHGLLAMDNNSLAYITKRFDRKGKHKLAVEDLCQLSLKSTEHKYRSSYEAVGNIIYQYASAPGDAVLKYFELILFSFIVGNTDMHMKNFSLLTEDVNNIRLAPAYDLVSTRLLIPYHLDPEESALPLNGKNRNLHLKDFTALGKTLRIPDKVISFARESMINKRNAWNELIENSFLPNPLKAQYTALIGQQIDKLI